VKIGLKFQFLCKISNISTSDSPVLLGQFQHCQLLVLVFSALTLFVGWQEGNPRYPPVKNRVVGCWRGYLSGQGADLHMAQLIQLPLIVSCSRLFLVLPFWYRLTWVVPNKIQRAVNGCNSSQLLVYTWH